MSQPERVRGIGFDATCSLVALDAADRPVTVSPSGDDQRNVIVWMDHRAIDQASRISRTGHRVLRYVGGVMSPEMESPKLLWLREHLPETWRAPRASSTSPTSSSTSPPAPTCARCAPRCASGRTWATRQRRGGGGDGDSSVGRWDDSFFRAIGLGDLVDEGYRRIGRRIRPMGEPVGQGCSAARRRELGLAPGTAVGVSIIDAHAGGLGVLGARVGGGDAIDPEALETRLALIGGTSSCHMAVSREARFIPGVWGPYFSAMVPGMWLTEGGQSATGSLIDHVVFGHARSEELRQEARASGKTVYEILNERSNRLAAGGRRSLPGRAHARPARAAVLPRQPLARAPTPRCAARSRASSSRTRSTTWRCSTSPPCRRSRTARATSSRR